MADLGSIREKIKALLTLAGNEGATEAEAATAMAKASALMAKYNIEVSADEETEDSTIRGKWVYTDKDFQWHYYCAEAAQYLYSCRFIWSRHRKAGGFQFVGRPDNIAAAELTYKWIVDQVQRLYKEHLPKGMEKWERAEYRRTFKAACAVRVRARAWHIVSQLARDDTLAIEMTGSTALVVRSKQEQLFKEADDLINQDDTLRDNVPAPKTSAGRGTRDGLAAGDQVKLNEQIQPEAPLAITHKKS